MTDLKSGFLPINIEPCKTGDSSTSPVFHAALVRRPQPSFHFPSRPLESLSNMPIKAGPDDGGSRKNTENESLSLHCFISNDVGRDGYGRGGEGRGEEGDRLKAESRSRRSERRDGLLGETREELFMVNLHINDSSLPLTISLLRCREHNVTPTRSGGRKKTQTECSRDVACV